MSDATPPKQALRDHVLDLVFLIGIAVKGLDALGELLLGIPLLFFSHAQLAAAAHAVTAEELSEDPHDLVAHLLLRSTAHAGHGTLLFVAVYLIVHGVVKLAIIAALIWGAERIYPWAIAALVAFTVFQVIEFVLHPSVSVVLLTVLDVVIIALTWREWRQHRSLRETLATTVRWIRAGRRRRRSAADASWSPPRSR
jgi:uncharacterized membrane protein